MNTPSPLSIALAWTPAALWAGLIWQLGTDQWSAHETSQLLLPLIEWLFPDLDLRSRYQLLLFLRKLAHPAVYGVLAALAFPAAAWTLRAAPGVLRPALALAPVAALAVSDEWRQSASPLRTGSAYDVLLDFAGGAAVILFALVVERWAGRRLFGPTTPDGRADPVV